MMWLAAGAVIAMGVIATELYLLISSVRHIEAHSCPHFGDLTDEDDDV
jgi:hypothetical protein